MTVKYVLVCGTCSDDFFLENQTYINQGRSGDFDETNFVLIDVYVKMQIVIWFKKNAEDVA